MKISAIATPPPTNEQARDDLEDAGTRMLDRRIAQRLGRPRTPARRAAAKTASWAISTPPPSAATSGTHELPGAKSVGTTPRSESSETIASASGRPASDAEHAGDERDDQRLAGDQAPDLVRRGAERAQDGDLAPALDDGKRERAGDDEQRDRTRDPTHRPEDGDERRPVGAARVARVGERRVIAIEHLERRRDARRRRRG